MLTASKVHGAEHQNQDIKMVKYSASEFQNNIKNLTNSQKAIDSLSTWCLERHKHYKNIIGIWLDAITKVSINKRLSLFYLANHVIQHSKKNRYKFPDGWKSAIQIAISHVRDVKIQPEISRVIEIWKKRGVYDNKYLSDLTDLLNTPIQKLKLADPVQNCQMNSNKKNGLASNKINRHEIVSPEDLVMEAVSKPPKDSLETDVMNLSDNGEAPKSDNDQKHPVPLPPPLPWQLSPPPMPPRMILDLAQQSVNNFTYELKQLSQPRSKDIPSLNKSQSNMEQPYQCYSNLIHNKPQIQMPLHVPRIQSKGYFIPKWNNGISNWPSRDPRNPRMFHPHSRSAGTWNQRPRNQPWIAKKFKNRLRHHQIENNQNL